MRKPDLVDDDEVREKSPSQQPQESALDATGMGDYARAMVDEKRDDRRRQRFVNQFVAPLRESEKHNGSQNARTFAAKWDAKMASASIPLKRRSEIFMMLLREYETTRMREELAQAAVEMHDWPEVKQKFETAFKPTMNNIVRDAAASLNMRQQPGEGASDYAVRWKDGPLLFPPTNNPEPDRPTEQNKWPFVATLGPALREPLMHQLSVAANNTAHGEYPSWHKIVTLAQNVEAATKPQEHVVKI